MRERRLGVSLLTSKQLLSKVDGNIILIDIGAYLPSIIKRKMTRKDGTTFLVQFHNDDVPKTK